MRKIHYFSLFASLISACSCLAEETLPGTKLLEEKGDLAALMVRGIHRYLEKERVTAEKQRPKKWKLDDASPEAYEKSIAPNRGRLKQLLGIVDDRVTFTDVTFQGGPNSPALIARNS